MERRLWYMHQHTQRRVIALAVHLSCAAVVATTSLFASSWLVAGVPAAFAAAGTPAQTAHRSQKCPPPARHDRLAEQAYAFQHRHFGCAVPSLDALIKAQKQEKALAATSSVGPAWTPLGPQPINTAAVTSQGNASGRITALAVDPTNSSDVWAGAANGGAWYSNNGGSSWSPMSDYAQSLSIGSIAIDPRAAQTVYFGTGEPNGSFDSYWGMGILKTVDGGTGWVDGPNAEPLGFNVFAGYSVDKIVVDPTNDNVVLAAVCCYTSSNGGVPNTGQTSPPQNGGIWRSTDAGITWCPVLSRAPNPDPLKCAGSPTIVGAQDATDLVMDPTDHNILFAGIAKGNASTSAIYESTDNGVTWQPLTNGLPDSSQVERTSLGISQGGQILYAALAANGSQGTPEGELVNGAMYFSSNQGAMWTPVTVPADLAQNGQQWSYTSVVAVSPVNDQVVYAGSVDLYVTTDGGASWSNVTNSYASGYVHADQHALAFFSSTSPAFYLGNDGGVYQSQGGLGTFTDLTTNLNITQFYGGSIGTVGGQAQLYGASQDNGLDQYPVGSISGAQMWNEVMGGDGMETLVDPTNNGTVYAEMSGFENVAKLGGGTCAGPTIIEMSTDGGSSWICTYDFGQNALEAQPQPFVMSPNNSSEMFVGTDHLVRTTNRWTSWASLGTSQFLGEVAEAIAIAPGDDNRIYVGTGKGNVFESMDGGLTFSRMQAQPTEPSSDAIVTGLAVDPTNENTVYATYSTFGSSSCSTGCHVWKTTTAGSAPWTDVSGSLPNAPFDGVIEVRAPASGCTTCQTLPTLVAASDAGVFASIDGASTWSVLGTNLPETQIDQIFAGQKSATIYVATHGRGMWSATLSSPQHVYFGSTWSSQPNSAIWSLDSVTGAVTWSKPTGAASDGDAVLANGALYVASGSDQVYSLNPTSGAVNWSDTFNSGPSGAASGPSLANNVVYFGGSDGYLYATNASSGSVLWKTCLCKTHGGPFPVLGLGPAAIANGVVYVAADSTYIDAVNASTGAVVWSYNARTATHGTDGTGLTVANGIVYAPFGNAMNALNASTGALLWTYSISTKTATYQPTEAAVAGGVAYFAFSNNYLYAVNGSTGSLVWSVPTGDPTGQYTMAPTVSGGDVYIGNVFQMDAYSSSNGTHLWAHGQIDGGDSYNGGSPVVANGAVYVGNNTYGIVALSASTGALLWLGPGRPGNSGNQWVPDNGVFAEG